MATDFSIALGELLDKTGANLDFLREAVQLLAQELMELEVSRKIGAQRHERTAERVTYRNGYRHRTWDTRVGTIDLRIPKLRQGSYFPSLLEPRRRAEKALVAVVQEAYIHGVSTRKVDELVQSLGMTGISKSDGPLKPPAPDLSLHDRGFRRFLADVIVGRCSSESCCWIQGSLIGRSLR